MKQEPVWKVGPVMESIYSTLQQILRLVEKSPKIYLDDAFLSEISVRKHEWDLADTDDFFACMTEEELAHLRPSDPIPDEAIPYEDVEYPESAQPQNVFDLESSGVRIEEWFHELQERKVSIDGCGCIWPEGSSSWAPRELFKYEDLCHGRRNPPHVPWTLSGAYYNDDQPHQIYHAWHGDEGREGIILRSELQILIRCMKGRMADPALCMHNVPVRSSLVSMLPATTADTLLGAPTLHPRHQSPNHDCPLQHEEKDTRYQMQRIRAIRWLRSKRKHRNYRRLCETSRLRGEEGPFL